MRGGRSQEGDHTEQQQNGDDLRDGDDGLEQAALAHAEVVDAGEGEDAGDGDGANAGIAERDEVRDVAGEDDAGGGDDAGVGAPEHGPAPQEAEGGREGLLEEDVDAAGARECGGELGADERAEEGEDAGGDPDGEDAGDGGDVAVDFRGLDEDGGADDDADHHGGGVEESDGTVGRGRQDGSECIMSAMADKKIIAVMGATGAQGGGLVRAILDDAAGEFTARAITRDVNSEKAKALAQAGAEVVAGDADDADSLDRAFAGAYGAYCVTFFWDHFSPEKELAHAEAMAQAAREAGLEHVIWSTLEDTRLWCR